ncbi:hypothetical protein SLS62_003334 [Diatrype stigma]|uniref:FHA domain-containing protein n=1 Tax=Diatrype stigma TaxID=117547 RepID=A0AAN9YUG4_9PEZI
MASAGSATSDKEDQVVAVLAARAPGPHFVEPERFVAAADNAWFDSPVMSRGHAELTVDFNTTPKVTFPQLHQTVYIKDIGSLHGTFHKHGDSSDGLGNENKLEPGQIVKVESGDTLRFGIDIYRAKETFPPCCVDFLVEETMDRINNPQQPNKTSTVSARCFSVSVPEDDFDDEDLISDGDSIVEEEIVPLPQHPPCPLSPSSIAAGKASMIDLTRDDVETSWAQGLSSMHQSSATIRNAADSDLIDLTSEPEASGSEEEDELRTRRQSTPFPPSQPQSINVDTSLSSSNVPWQAFDERFHTKPQDVVTSGPHTAKATESYGSEAHLSEMAESEDYEAKAIGRASLVSDGIRFTAPGYEASSMSGSESPRLSTEELDSNLTDEDEDDQSIVSVESKNDTTSQDSDAADQDSVSSELGEEYDVMDGMMDDFEDEEEDEDLQYDSDSASCADEELDDSMFVRHQSPSLVSKPSSPTEPEPGKPASKVSDETVEQSPEDLGSHTLASTAPFSSVATRQRLPSPSDAAMVKTLPFSTSCTTSTAQALGEKTGKFEYFTARESNRATFMNLDRPKSPPPTSAIRETLAGDKEVSQLPSRHSPARNTFVVARKAMLNKSGATNSSNSFPTIEPLKPAVFSVPSYKVAESKSAYTTIHQDSVWSDSGDKFINSPASLKALWSRTRLQSPDLDMTSAYTFQQSKLARENMAEAVTVKRVQIQDLLAQDPKYTPPVEGVIGPVVTEPQSTSSDTSKAQAGSKRSFGDAFAEADDVPGEVDASSHEIALRVGSEPAGQAAPACHQQAIDSPKSVPDSVHTAVAGNPTASIEPSTVRPAKRRRFAEVAACVALGGAGVLSALIMSAPTFT